MILKILNFILILSLFIIFIPIAKAATVILYNRDSYDFSTNTRGDLSGGDFYFGDHTVSGKFWANNLCQRGLQDLGDIGFLPLSEVSIPSSGYYRFGVLAAVNHTYVSLAEEGEEGNYIVFRVLRWIARRGLYLAFRLRSLQARRRAYAERSWPVFKKEGI